MATGSAQGGRTKAPRSVEELTRRNVALVAELDDAAREKLTPVERCIDRITTFCGSPGFLWAQALFVVLWVGLNLLPGTPHWDPPPFSILAAVVSMEALLLSTFILMTQNRQAVLADRRNHLDLQMSLLAEQENTKILSLVHRIAKRLGVDEDDPEVGVLAESARPEKLVEQIEEVTLAPAGERES
jgi:uncharacterized membrane protein